MKKFTSYVLLICALAIMAGCSDVGEILSEAGTPTLTTDIQRTRTVDEALAYASEWFSEMDSLNGTRTASSREVQSVNCVTAQNLTRSSETDTLLYLVNYKDNKGFALLGTPAASEDIYAISEDGSLEINDTVFNKGLQIFIEAAEGHAAKTLSDPPYEIRYTYHIKRRGGVLLHDNVAKWNQSAPFNKYSFTDDGKQGVVGCGPVATGMLMAHYRYPKSLNGKTIDWTAIIENNDYDKIAYFLETIAGPDYLAAHYYSGTSPRYSTTDSIYSTFRKFGYGVADAWNFVDFHSNRNFVFDFMYNGIPNKLSKAPLIFYGFRPGSAHVWIGDAFIERTKTPGLSNIATEANPMIHFVWGWGGRGNGYFLYCLDNQHLNSSNTDGFDLEYEYRDLNVIGRFAPIN